MAGAIDTLVLLYPYPADHQGGDASELAAANTLSAFWQRTGLTPLDADPRILGQSTANTALPAARHALRPVESVEITVPRSAIHDEMPAEWNMLRHTLFQDFDG